jgi:hypothetical protein
MGRNYQDCGYCGIGKIFASERRSLVFFFIMSNLNIHHSLLKSSWNPFVQTVKVPSMGDINERLSWISSERTKKDIIDNKVDLFLKPPVDHFGTLNYDKFGTCSSSPINILFISF